MGLISAGFSRTSTSARVIILRSLYFFSLAAHALQLQLAQCTQPLLFAAATVAAPSFLQADSDLESPYYAPPAAVASTRHQLQFASPGTWIKPKGLVFTLWPRPVSDDENDMLWPPSPSPAAAAQKGDHEASAPGVPAAKQGGTHHQRERLLTTLANRSVDSGAEGKLVRREATIFSGGDRATDPAKRPAFSLYTGRHYINVRNSIALETAPSAPSAWATSSSRKGDDHGRQTGGRGTNGSSHRRSSRSRSSASSSTSSRLRSTKSSGSGSRSCGATDVVPETARTSPPPRPRPGHAFSLQEGFRFAKLRYCDPVNLRSRIFHLIQRGASKVPCIAVESTETDNLFTDPADRQRYHNLVRTRVANLRAAAEKKAKQAVAARWYADRCRELNGDISYDKNDKGDAAMCAEDPENPYCSRTSSCYQEEPDSHEFARELAEIRTASASASAVLRMEAIGVTGPVRYFEIDLAEWEALDASGIVPHENAYAIDVPRLFYQRVALIDAFFRKEGILNAIELVADAETFGSCDEEDQNGDDSDEADSTDERSGTIGESHSQRRTRELAVLGSRNHDRSTMMLSPQQEPEQGPPSSKPRSLLYSISFPPQRKAKERKARPTARDMFNNRVEELWRKLLSNEIWEERSIERYVWEHYGDTLYPDVLQQLQRTTGTAAKKNPYLQDNWYHQQGVLRLQTSLTDKEKRWHRRQLEKKIRLEILPEPPDHVGAGRRGRVRDPAYARPGDGSFGSCCASSSIEPRQSGASAHGGRGSRYGARAIIGLTGRGSGAFDSVVENEDGIKYDDISGGNEQAGRTNFFFSARDNHGTILEEGEQSVASATSPGSSSRAAANMDIQGDPGADADVETERSRGRGGSGLLAHLHEEVPLNSADGASQDEHDGRNKMLEMDLVGLEDGIQVDDERALRAGRRPPGVRPVVDRRQDQHRVRDCCGDPPRSDHDVRVPWPSDVASISDASISASTTATTFGTLPAAERGEDHGADDDLLERLASMDLLPSYCGASISRGGGGPAAGAEGPWEYEAEAIMVVGVGLDRNQRTRGDGRGQAPAEAADSGGDQLSVDINVSGSSTSLPAPAVFIGAN